MTISITGTTGFDSDLNRIDLESIGVNSQHPRTQAVVLTAAASSSNGIQTVSSAGVDLFTDDATFDCVVTALDFTISTLIHLFYKFEDADNVWNFSINANGTLNFKAIASTVTVIDVTTTAAIKFAEGSWGRITGVLTREGATKKGSFSFYQNGLLLETVSINIAALATISNTGNLYRLGTNAKRSAATVSSSTLFNRAFNASDVVLLALNGVAAIDKWASITKTNVFTADADDWVAQDGTVAGNIDAISDGTTSKDNNLRFTSDSGSSTHFIKDTTNFAVNTRYRVRGSYFIPNSQTAIDGIKFFQEADISLSSLLNVTGTWTAFDLILNNIVTVADVRINAMAGDAVVFTDAGGDDVFYIANGMTVEKLGCTQSLESCGIDASLQWKDSSTNKFHAMLPAAGATPLVDVKTFEIRGENTYAGAHAAQPVTGIDQAVFPASTPIFIEQWLMTIAGTTVHDILIGDGSDVDRWVAITSGIAAGKSALTVANAVDDGTNLKMVLDPDTNATAVYSSVVSGRVMEA